MLFPFHDENPIKRTPVVTVAIIVINTAVLIYMNSLISKGNDRQLRQFIFQHGFVPARITQLQENRPLTLDMYREQAQNVPANRTIRLEPKRGEVIVSAFTAMFMHAGWFHLVSNMWFFWIFGNNIEDRLGHVMFLIFYLAGGIVATICHAWVSKLGVDPVIGASGAVAVTLGAYAVFYPFAKVKSLLFLFIYFRVLRLPALAVLGFWFLGQIYQGVRSIDAGGAQANVAWWAHIGGFVVGALMMPLLAAIAPGERASWSWDLPEQLPDDYYS